MYRYLNNYNIVGCLTCDHKRRTLETIAVILSVTLFNSPALCILYILLSLKIVHRHKNSYG